MSDPRADGTSHLGVELWHAGKRYYAAKYGQKWVVNLGTKARHPKPELVEAIMTATGADHFHYVTDDDSVAGVCERTIES